VYFGIGPMAGALTDRFGARAMICAGQWLLASGLVVASLAHTEAVLAAGYIAGIGLGVGLTYVPVTSAVQTLCTRRGTLAASIAAAGIGVGSMSLPPAVAALSAMFDWRATLQAMAGVALIAPLAARPFATPAPQASPPRVSQHLTRRFAALYLAQLFAAVVAFVPLAHLVTFALAKGLPLPSGVLLLSVVGIGSIAGRLGINVATARFGVYFTGGACSAAMSGAILALAMLRALPAIGAAVAVFGVGYGGFNALLGPLAMQACGPAGLGRSVGIVATSRAIGVLLGPWLVGLGAWWLGGYTLPLIGCALVAALSGLLMAALAVGDAAGRQGVQCVVGIHPRRRRAAAWLIGEARGKRWYSAASCNGIRCPYNASSRSIVGSAAKESSAARKKVSKPAYAIVAAAAKPRAQSCGPT
jgi:predicted MFS family arabinose efflux permease